MCNQNCDTRQMLLYRRVLLLAVRVLSLFHCICSLKTMKVKTELPSKNHQSTFTAITADTRMRTRKIRSDTMTVTAMTKAIVYIGLNYIFILFFLRSSFLSRSIRKYCINFAITVTTTAATTTTLSSTDWANLAEENDKQSHKRGSYNRSHSEKLFDALS